MALPERKLMFANTIELALIMGTSAILVTGLAMIGRIQRHLILGLGPSDRWIALIYCFSLALLVGSVGIMLCQQAHSTSPTQIEGRLP
jgi:hypothetical protein